MSRGRRSNAKFLPSVLPNSYSAQGWADYHAGKGFPPEYETWDEVAQRHYERGRLRASGAYLVYREVPPEEPCDIVQRTNGLQLVPRSALARFRRRRLAAVDN